MVLNVRLNGASHFDINDSDETDAANEGPRNKLTYYYAWHVKRSALLGG
jgi:hypothetical protein